MSLTPTHALAKALATIDGKLDAFLAEASGTMNASHPDYTGHFDGYTIEAREILTILAGDGFELSLRVMR